jgi:hypothetical protein
LYAAWPFPNNVQLKRASRAESLARKDPSLWLGRNLSLGASRSSSEPAATDAPYPGPLLFLYSASLYATYAVFQRSEMSFHAAPAPLYAAHVALLTATVRVLDDGFAISVTWAVAALVALTYAVKRDGQIVGQSSLVIFAASGLKVLLFDLSNSAPMLRVLTLVVLAASLYGGGWLYQQMSKEQEDYHPDPAVNTQLRLIRGLVDDGLDDETIAAELRRTGVRRLGSEDSWSAEPIAQIRRDYNFS